MLLVLRRLFKEQEHQVNEGVLFHIMKQTDLVTFSVILLQIWDNFTFVLSLAISFIASGPLNWAS